MKERYIRKGAINERVQEYNPDTIIDLKSRSSLLPGIGGSVGLSVKGAPARESRTGTRLVSPARDREKKKSTPNKINLEP